MNKNSLLYTNKFLLIGHNARENIVNYWNYEAEDETKKMMMIFVLFCKHKLDSFFRFSLSLGFPCLFSG